MKSTDEQRIVTARTPPVFLVGALLFFPQDNRNPHPVDMSASLLFHVAI
jgi:hypothetical protein